MYVNKCIKCGTEFETKNPKRVICPNCLYPDKSMMPSGGGSENHENHNHEEREQNTEQQENQQSYRSDSGYNQGGYSAGGYSTGGYSSGGYDRPQRNNYNQGGGYQSRGGYDRNQGGYQSRGGYGQNRQGGYNSGRPQQGQRRPNSFQQRRPGGGGRPQWPQRPQQQKQLLISKEQLEQIEVLYKAMLPLPNPDAHEVIGEKIGLEAKKVFFGINLVRQKMMLPKLPFPKRKLAISPDQLMAIRSLYEPLLPLPPIGCHKIIAIQLKIDEWRVHVGIGLIRSQMGLDRWNPDREDAPEEFM